MRYVLITPAKNEAKSIGKTIESVVSQTVQPLQWVIVSDGSTDSTDDVVKDAASNYPFIVYKRNDSPVNKDFSSKVNAFNLGQKSLTVSDYQYIGNLDADVSFEKDYFKQILTRFSNDPKLGLAGGLVWEYVHGKAIPFKVSLNSVSGAVQFFRRICFEEIGGYIPIKSGGIDSAAEIQARACGWIVETFPEYKVLHHGPMLTGTGNVQRMMFRSGITKYKLGYHPLFHFMSCAGRLFQKPAVLGALYFFAGYCYAALKRETIILPDYVVGFLRKEQLGRLVKPGRFS